MDKEASYVLIFFPSWTFKVHKEWNKCVSKSSVQRLIFHEKVVYKWTLYLSLALQYTISAIAKGNTVENGPQDFFRLCPP